MKLCLLNMKYLVMAILLSAFNSCTYYQSYRLVTTSPGGTYRIEIAEEENDNVRSSTLYTAFRNGEAIIEKAGIYNASPPPYFAEVYTSHYWTAENQLWIGGSLPKSFEQGDEITIVNRLSMPVTSLLITRIRSQTLLLFDLQPQSTIKSYNQPTAIHEPKSSSFIVVCKLANGGEIVSEPVDFPNLERYTGRLHFCLVIRDGQILLSSRELEGKYEDTKALADTMSSVSSKSDAEGKAIPQAKYIIIPRGDCDSNQ